ncbi:RNA binding protein, putative [Giardia lamblia P15]|uniref:RNA binding protein, putative n=1 Tax=Giardia intestinalis (strain P15) TaxID=658858 RepID=E1F494_GIAIA|nr:RNA binding protein, putative [Giardia lamblia P15]
MAFDAKKLYVGNLPYDCTFKELKAPFARIVPVSNAEIVQGRDGKSKGFGVLQFTTVDDLQDVLAYHKHSPIEIGGRVLIVRPYSDKPPERDNAQKLREALNVHPVDYKSIPNSFLIYNIPPERRDPKELFQIVHSAYRHVVNLTMHTTSVKDWRNEGVKEPITYAVVYMSKEAEQEAEKQFLQEVKAESKTQKGKTILSPEQAAANIFKKLKDKWKITAASKVIVRPHDTGASPRMTTVILRNLPFTIYANTIFEVVKDKYPVIELRLPSRTISGRTQGSGFAFLVLATHSDAVALVSSVKLRVLHHTSILDWGLDKNTFERQQQVIARAAGDTVDDTEDRSRSVSESGSNSESDDTNYSYSGVSHSDSDTEDNAFSSADASDNEPSFELYEDGKTIIKPFVREVPTKEQDEPSYDPNKEQAYDEDPNVSSDTDNLSELLDNEIKQRDAQNEAPEIKSDGTKDQQEEIERTIFVTNLPSRVTAARMAEAEKVLMAKNANCRPQDILVSGLRYELRRLFSAFGMVRDVSIVVNKTLDRHTGSAFIIFKKRGAALCAMEYYNSLKNQAFFSRNGKEAHSTSHTLAVGDGLDDPYMKNLARLAAEERGKDMPDGQATASEQPPADDPNKDDHQRKKKAKKKNEESTDGEEGFFSLEKDASAGLLADDDKQKLIEIREAAKTGNQDAYTSLSREEIHRLILSRFKVPEEYIDYTNGLLVINGSPLTLKPAIERQQLKTIEKHRSEKTDAEDPRNLSLSRIGLLIPGIDGFSKADVPPEDVRKRIKYWKTLKGLMTNQSIHISRTRIVIRNIPKEFDERKISWIVIRSFGRINESEARAMFNPNDKNYEYKVLMRLLKSVGCTEMRFRRGTKAYNLVKSMDDVYNEEGYMDNQHSGFCFVEFTSHESALRCLLALNNNPRSFYRDRRPICEFAAENVRTLYHRSQRDQARSSHQDSRNESRDHKGLPQRRDKHEYSNDWISGKFQKNRKKQSAHTKKPSQELTRFDGKGGPVRERGYDRIRPKSKAAKKLKK